VQKILSLLHAANSTPQPTVPPCTQAADPASNPPEGATTDNTVDVAVDIDELLRNIEQQDVGVNLNDDNGTPNVNITGMLSNINFDQLFQNAFNEWESENNRQNQALEPAARIDPQVKQVSLHACMRCEEHAIVCYVGQGAPCHGCEMVGLNCVRSKCSYFILFFWFVSSLIFTNTLSSPS
jgi:hypothetical protein